MDATDGPARRSSMSTIGLLLEVLGTGLTSIYACRLGELGGERQEATAPGALGLGPPAQPISAEAWALADRRLRPSSTSRATCATWPSWVGC